MEQFEEVGVRGEGDEGCFDVEALIADRAQVAEQGASFEEGLQKDPRDLRQGGACVEPAFRLGFDRRGKVQAAVRSEAREERGRKIGRVGPRVGADELHATAIALGPSTGET